MNRTIQPHSDPGGGLEERVHALGRSLRQSLERLVTEVPGGPQGPQRLATALGLDKVLASRLLKALRSPDPLAVVHRLPGPEPLRRALRAARKVGASQDAVREASASIEAFDAFIREEAGDRSSLDAILSAWLPEARREFELRRKQAAFKALSQLKGAYAELDHSAVFLAPAADGRHLDVVWLIGMADLQRLRPGVVVKFDTRRLIAGGRPRRPTTLDGKEIEGLDPALRLDEFCDGPPAPLEARPVGDVVHYTLGDAGFGPRSGVDILFAEVNRAEIPRRVPHGSGRRGYVFADVKVPAKRLYLDVFVHREVYPASEPELVLYDTTIDGVADVNDPIRDIDRLDQDETIRPLGVGVAKADIPAFSRRIELLEHALRKLGWDAQDFRGYRVEIDYPIYGSQIVVAFEAPEEQA